MPPSSWMRFSGHQVNSSLVFQALSLIFLSIASAQNTSPGTITIQDSPIFSSQRGCAQECFTGEWGGDLGSGCPSPIENACYCRPDLAPSAIYTLSSCVYNGCNENANDVQTAISLYSAYCDVTAQSSTIVGAPSTAASAAVTVTATESSTIVEGPSTAASPSGTVTATVTTIIVKSSTNSLTASPNPSSRVSLSSSTTSLTSQSALATSNSGQGSSDSFWTKAQGIVSIASIIVASLLAIAGMWFSFRRRQRRATTEGSEELED